MKMSQAASRTSFYNLIHIGIIYNSTLDRFLIVVCLDPFFQSTAEHHHVEQKLFFMSGLGYSHGFKTEAKKTARVALLLL